MWKYTHVFPHTYIRMHWLGSNWGRRILPKHYKIPPPSHPPSLPPKVLSLHNEPTELRKYLVNLYTVHIYTQKHLSSFQVSTVTDQGRICKICFLRKLHVYILYIHPRNGAVCILVHTYVGASLLDIHIIL